MFGLGGLGKNESVDEEEIPPRGGKSTKQRSSKKTRQRRRPPLPESSHSHSIVSSESEPDREGFLSRWTSSNNNHSASIPDEEQSESQHSSEHDSEESQSSGSTTGSYDDDSEESHSRSSESRSETSSRTSSNSDSQGESDEDDDDEEEEEDSALESPGSTHSHESSGSSRSSSSSMISSDSYMLSPETSQMVSPETLGEDSAILSSDAIESTTTPLEQQPQQQHQSMELPLSYPDIFNHLMPPRLVNDESHEEEEDEYDDEHGSSSMMDRHVLSGDDADDEMTLFSNGEDTMTQGMSMDTMSMSIDAADAKGNSGGEQVNEMVRTQHSNTQLRSQISGESTGSANHHHHLVGPNLTSSTIHSSSTQPRGTITNNSNTAAAKNEHQSTREVTRKNSEDESVRDIGVALEKAKDEFVGGSSNHQTSPSQYEMESNVTNTDLNTPSFMNRNDMFYKSASHAVAALLTPRDKTTEHHANSDRSDVLMAVRTGGSSNNMQLKPPPSTVHACTSNPSASTVFQPPVEGKDTSMQSSLARVRRDVSEHLINPKTEQKLESMENQMMDPTKTLADLLTAIATPDDLSTIDLGYMVRRKNACGALKVMTNDARKRVRICWTVGVLPALTSVLKDSCAVKDGTLSFADQRIRYEYEAARDRAISALLNLSMPKENRMAVFHTPGLIQAIIFLISEDSDTARRGCTAIMAYLAKSPENRLLMAQIPGIVDSLVHILAPMPPRVESGGLPSVSSKKKHPYSSMSDDSTSDSRSKQSRKNRSTSSEDSQITFKVVASQSPIELFGYDETADPMLRATRQNVFALIGHLSKEKDNAYYFARSSDLLKTMIKISNCHDSPTHALAVKFLANLSRHRLNTKIMVFQERDTLPALVKATTSEYDEARLYACYAIQNIAQDKSCRQELAGIDDLVTRLCRRGRFAQVEDERLSAISAIKNLCDEPANLIPLTNTPECIATLMHLAHGREEGVTEMMQYQACDALATLSHWLRKIASNGQALNRKNGDPQENGLFVPSLRVVTWNQWQ